MMPYPVMVLGHVGARSISFSESTMLKNGSGGTVRWLRQLADAYARPVA